jgi:hypothetical protein
MLRNRPRRPNRPINELSPIFRFSCWNASYWTLMRSRVASAFPVRFCREIWFFLRKLRTRTL